METLGATSAINTDKTGTLTMNEMMVSTLYADGAWFTVDGEGYVSIVDRKKDMIIRGGFNVYPPEVEAALNDHPRVIQTAVIGRRIEGGNEEVLAFCQTDDPALVTERDLREHVAERLSPYKRPSRIIVTTALPTSPNGKILKQNLVETFRDALDALDASEAQP